MSFASDDNLGYLETVQLYFTELTGRMVLFGGRDLELLAEWRQRGATASAVCRGLREAVERMPDDDPPRGIYACRERIESHVERSEGRRHLERDAQGPAANGAGGRGGEESSGDSEASPDEGSYVDRLVASALDRVETAGRRSDSDDLTAAYRLAWRRLKRLEETETTRETLERLSAVERALVEAHYRALGRDERRAVDERLEEKSGPLLDEMSEEARRTHRLARIREILAEADEFDPIVESSV